MDHRHFEPGSRRYLDLQFPAAPSDRPYVIVNMVGSLDGKAVIEGTEKGLGSREDQQRMQELRAHADAVMNGAGTLRRSGATSRLDDPALVEWRRARGKSSDHPLGTLVTTRAEFELTGDYFEGGGLQSVIFASEISAERIAEIEARGPRVAPIPSGESNLRDAVLLLHREYGVRLLLVEGGPTLNAQLLRLDLIDELFLTLGPTLVGGRDTLTILEGPGAFTREMVPRGTLLSVIANNEASELELRYRFHPTAEAI